VTPAQVAVRAAIGGLAGFALSVLTGALLEAMRTYRSKKVFDVGQQVVAILTPSSLGGWLTIVGLVALALTVALTTAAYVVARRGIVARPAGGAAGPPAIPVPPGDLDV
jgi:cell division protein FtsX